MGEDRTQNDRDLFIAALGHEDPSERAAYLRDACGPDARQRIRVEDLLEIHEGAGSFLEPPADVLAPRNLPFAPPGEGPGAVVGPYRLLQPIGEGGMGSVYMAEQTRPVKRLVALKVIKAGVDSRLVLARFEAERQALALMDHPNIARVFDAGSTDAGRPYFVMELVKGVPITAFCDDRRLSLRERLELVIPVCHAVQHAHQKGIIHRDLKPANVLVALYDGRPVPKVIDFGVAKATGPPMTDRTLYTEFGTVVGTLEYMSPEQAELNQLDIDTRSDVYSLGVLLYELLTGTTPLDRKRIKQATFLELLRAVREEESPRPSARLSTTRELPSIAASRSADARKLSGLLRQELDWIVMKALEKDRQRRYETANGLASDLRRYLDGEPVQACPPSAGYRVRKLIGRNKAALSTVLLTIAALAVGTVVSTWQALRARRAEQKIAAALLTAEQQRDVAAARTREAADRARSLDRQLYVSRVDRAYSEWSANNVAEAEQLLEACPEHLRGWEWRQVHRLCHLDLLTYVGHTRAATSAAFTPDGSRVVSGAGGGWVSTGTLNADSASHATVGEIAVWDARTGRESFALRGLQGGIQAVAISPDGTRVASCNRMGHVAVWDASGGLKVFDRTETGAGAQGLCIAFTPDGRRVAVGYGNFQDTTARGYCKLWDAASGQELRKLPGPVGGVQGLAISPDGARIALTGMNAVDLWQLGTGERLSSIVGHSGLVQGVAFSPDGARIATADDEVRIRDSATGAVILSLRGPTGGIYGVAFSPDGARIAAASDDRSVTLWDASNGAELARYRGHTSFVKSVAFSPDGGRLVSTCNDGEVKVWDIVRSRPIAFRPGAAKSFAGWSIAFSNDGRQLAGSWDADHLGLWDPETGECLSTILQSALGIAYSPDGRRLATAGTTPKIAIRDAKTGAPTRFLTAPSTPIYRLAYSPDGLQLASGGAEPIIRFWDLKAGQSTQHLHGQSGAVTVLAYSPDGHRLLSASDHAELIVWDVATGEHLFHHRRPIPAIGAPGIAAAFSPDGRHVAWANHTDIEVYDAESGSPIRTLRGHTARIMSVAYCPDGSRLASASRDRTIKLWDAATGEETFTLRGHTGSAFCLAYSPDGHRLASEDMMSDFRIWDATPLDPEKHDLAARAARLRATVPGVHPGGGVGAGGEAASMSSREPTISGAFAIRFSQAAEFFRSIASPPPGGDAAEK